MEMSNKKTLHTIPCPICRERVNIYSEQEQCPEVVQAALQSRRAAPVPVPAPAPAPVTPATPPQEEKQKRKQAPTPKEVPPAGAGGTQANGPPGRYQHTGPPMAPLPVPQPQWAGAAQAPAPQPFMAAPPAAVATPWGMQHFLQMQPQPFPGYHAGVVQPGGVGWGGQPAGGVYVYGNGAAVPPAAAGAGWGGGPAPPPAQPVQQQQQEISELLPFLF